MAVRLTGEVDNSCECISVSALDLLGLDHSVDFPSFPVLFATGAGVSGEMGQSCGSSAALKCYVTSVSPGKALLHRCCCVE